MNPLFDLAHNPFYRLERRGRLGWVIRILCGLVLAGIYGTLVLIRIYPGSEPAIAVLAFYPLAAMAACLVANFLPPALVGDCLSHEKEELRLDAIIISRFPPDRLLAGKLAARLRDLVFGLLLLLPAFAAVPALFHHELLAGARKAGEALFSPGAMGMKRPDPPANAHVIRGYVEREATEGMTSTQLAGLEILAVLAVIASVLGTLALSTGVSVAASALARGTTAALGIAYGAAIFSPCLVFCCAAYVPGAMLGGMFFGMPGSPDTFISATVGIYGFCFLTNGLASLAVGGALVYCVARWFEVLNLR